MTTNTTSASCPQNNSKKQIYFSALKIAVNSILPKCIKITDNRCKGVSYPLGFVVYCIAIARNSNCLCQTDQAKFIEANFLKLSEHWNTSSPRKVKQERGLISQATISRVRKQLSDEELQSIFYSNEAIDPRCTNELNKFHENINNR